MLEFSYRAPVHPAQVGYPHHIKTLDLSISAVFLLDPNDPRELKSRGCN